MTEEDRKGIAQEYRKSIARAMRDIDDIKFLRRIYISVLLASQKNNHCDIATEGEQHE